MKQHAPERREIDENITSVSEIVDNNSVTSQQTAAVSEELQAQVETMVQMLENLKV